MVDVAVVGAGMAGLTCAQQLKQAGYCVVVVEKSRGLGGRVATRRLPNGCADHGMRYLDDQGELTQQLMQALIERRLLQVWTDTEWAIDKTGKLRPQGDRHPRYAAPAGITAVAKFLAAGLEVWRSQRVTALLPTSDQKWQVRLEAASVEAAPELTVRAIVLAIPAPQALMLLEPLRQSVSPEITAALRTVEYQPCLSAIVAYTDDRHQVLTNCNLPWRSVVFNDDPVLAWVGLDSSKHPDARHPVFVLHSAATFAQQHLEAVDLTAAGQQMLDRAAQTLIPWLAEPATLQVHRWRYAFVSHPWRDRCLSSKLPLPLVCCGDWCGGDDSEEGTALHRVETALRAGQAAATEINAQLESRNLPDLDFSTFS